MAKNRNGQGLGSKGQKTRARIIEAALELLETTALRDLRVADVARAAATSSATFYVYFSDVPDVVLAATSELSQSTPEILELLSRRWQADAAALAEQLVDHHIAYWEAHRTLFRIRNLAAEEGDKRFIAARTASVIPLLDAIAIRIEAAQASGSLSTALHPEATAGVLIAMLERVAAVLPDHRRGTFTQQDLKNAAAHMIANMLYERE